MFSWFRSKPTCPIPAVRRDWIEERFRFLADEFGWDRLRRIKVVTPTREFFPEPFEPTEASIRRWFERACVYMAIDPDRVELTIYEERRSKYLEAQSGTAGLYEEVNGRQVVAIELSNLEDALQFVATAAHELGHVHLLGDGHVSSSEADHEPLTDLMTVYHGLGIFTANAVIQERTRATGRSISRQGYLSMPDFGYALAVFTLARGEPRPDWAKHLRLDVRTTFQQSLRYLAAEGVAEFGPDR